MDPSSSLIGRTLGGTVTIEAFLGEGGFAWIFRAQRGSPPTEVAVKILNTELTSDETFVRRFVREAKTAISVAHPNAVQILDYGVDGDLVYIVMELVRGENLIEVLLREKRLSQKRAVKIVAQMCDALEAAHDQGIVHRDVKPENVMLLGDPSQPMGEWVKVLDFGIAKLLADEGRHGRPGDSEPPDSGRAVLTRLGTVLGTPEYMAPEQAKGAAVDGRCDLYACGVLLYQLVTGRLPFQGLTPAHTATLHIDEPPPPPSTFAPDLDLDLEKVILKALAKSPSDRHQNAHELREQLGGLVPRLSDVAAPIVDRVAVATAATVAALPAARSVPVERPAPSMIEAPPAPVPVTAAPRWNPTSVAVALVGLLLVCAVGAAAMFLVR